MHFGYGMDEPRIASGAYHLHIPVRDPMEVAASWARRDKNTTALLQSYESMFKHINAGVSHTLHKMEDIARLAGTDDNDRDQIRDSASIDRYKDMVLREVVTPNQQFFDQFYG